MNDRINRTMPRKLPKKTKDHDNSRVAKRNLEDYFGNWNISRLDDESSGMEYGQDWMIGIVTPNGEVTGMEFRVQSKVLRGKKAIRGDFLCDQISITTINYLYDLSVPVLFHFFHQPTKQGYVMWLDTWYIENQKEKWEQQETVLVKIPLTSKLDKNMVDLVSKYVWEKHHKHKLRKTVDLLNETSNDYKVKVDFVNNDTWLVVDAKHDDAIPAITPLDAEAESTLQKAVEQGIPLQITGKFGITNIPEILIGDMELIQLSVVPRLMDLPKFPIRVQYMDENEQIIYETKYVEMIPTQHGSVIKKWEGNALADCLKYSIEYNATNQTYSFGFGLQDGEKNPTQICRFFDVNKTISQAKRCRVFDPRNDNIFLENALISQFQLTDQVKAVEALSRALDTIQNLTGKTIEIPNKFSGDDIMSAEGIADVLKTGIYSQLIGGVFPQEDFVLILDGSKEWADHIINNANKTSEPLSYLHEGPLEVHATVLGHDINLGPCEYIFQDLQFLEIQSHSENEARLVFSFNRDTAFTRFPQWYREQ